MYNFLRIYNVHNRLFRFYYQIQKAFLIVDILYRSLKLNNDMFQKYRRYKFLILTFRLNSCPKCNVPKKKKFIILISKHYLSFKTFNFIIKLFLLINQVLIFILSKPIQQQAQHFSTFMHTRGGYESCLREGDKYEYSGYTSIHRVCH